MSNTKDVKMRMCQTFHSSKLDPEGNSKAIKIKFIPFGFFERELLHYFSQFGYVRRVRVARNRKTGNDKGWAFVLFSNRTVAQLAAEAMDGYLMYEKRLECKVLKNKDFPRCLRKGPRIVQPPVKNATTERHALNLNAVQNGWNEEAAKHRLLKNWKIKRAKFAKLGYHLPPIANLPETQKWISVTSEAEESKAKEIKLEDLDIEVVEKSSEPPMNFSSKRKAKIVKSKK